MQCIGVGMINLSKPASVSSACQPGPPYSTHGAYGASAFVRSLSPDRFASNGWSWKTARRDAQHYYETYYCLGH